MPPAHRRRLDRLSAELPNPDAGHGDVGDLPDDALLTLLLRHFAALADVGPLPEDDGRQAPFLDGHRARVKDMTDGQLTSSLLAHARALLPDTSNAGIDAALATSGVTPDARPRLAALLRAHRPTSTEGSPIA